MRIECACFSCRQRQEWSVAEGCPGVEAYASPTDLTFLDNAVTAVEGEEHLRTHILRAGGTTRWLAATCCGSILVVSNPLYKGNLVAIPRATSTLQCHEAMLPLVRVQTNGWSARRVGDGYPDETQMPAFEGPVVDGRSVVKMLWRVWTVGFLAAMGVVPHREDGDRTVEGIMGDTGDVVDLNIPENTHVAKDDKADKEVGGEAKA
jgi:hypothetical protein